LCGLSVRFVVAILLLCCSLLVGRTGDDDPARISGRITDAVTGLPLPSVNVFLAGTTRGTVTGPDGRYAIGNIPPGHFQIVASRVGNVVSVAEIDLRPGEEATWDAALDPRELKGQEVEVLAPSPDQWKADLASFRREFLGAGEGAESCVLENPEVLDFRRHETSGVLGASAQGILRVSNLELGYRLDITLVSFAWDSLQGAIDYTLYVQFHPLPAARPEDSLRWEESRRRTYRGSLRHFLRSLIHRRLSQAGFYVTTGMGEEVGTDATKILVTRPDGVRLLATEDVLIIDYGGSSILQRNLIRLVQGVVHIRPDATLIEQNDLLIDPGSFWAMQRVGSMLPLDYVDRAER
jgi:hypothetical protein